MFVAQIFFLLLIPLPSLDSIFRYPVVGKKSIIGFVSHFCYQHVTIGVKFLIIPTHKRIGVSVIDLTVPMQKRKYYFAAALTLGC